MGICEYCQSPVIVTSSRRSAVEHIGLDVFGGAFERGQFADYNSFQGCYILTFDQF